MLVRSADKRKLVNLDNVRKVCVTGSRIDDDLVEIQADGITLGEYSTEEKAISVLDRMYSAYNSKAFVDGVTFQMPRDSEV